MLARRPVGPLSSTATQLLEGGAPARRVTQETRERLGHFAHLTPTLAAVIASDDPATRVYVERKANRARKLGVTFRTVDLGAQPSQQQLEDQLAALSADAGVHGVVLELPLSPHLDAERALLSIAPHKDVEGLSPANLALIAAGREEQALLPPTPTSCLNLLELGLQARQLELRGAHIAVIGPGRTVGRPLVWMLNNRGVTVTLCNPHTRQLARVLEGCDALVVAVGRPCLLEARHVQHHHVVIDAGINVVANMVVGDVAPDVADAVSAITPVPGGVGPLTSALMFANFARALELQAT
ncbi:bifunctional 5,10-methylenetetrahydrofolate dehydrogenase/5,10-methenyltetrahydrofolate cyclohydrolase [Deinococcus peraridilitoris]|uniref:Bifunctional protein FolD n=1 Tax=Deinococcus peraridilitoris (strain DSM 19664 / LMG 22246 / CIP 109416 / KR-200) TaxID=937777 RepID=L0A7Y9_DEIPD|nr:bifunctional 5,10-methylenetetrahydrofolate dehydrogenase/5,10-methenyltetrahydrofolate cyclohydrolase [Deinococcus peraridilitoris]AFZ69155.1 5,10-methylene-tetrahydrofolate dehydrogenase/methenyl tetrahydrofolate cyclohydrolase [Deinococcus peraridilitoris DSM 19664]